MSRRIFASLAQWPHPIPGEAKACLGGLRKYMVFSVSIGGVGFASTKVPKWGESIS